MNTMISRQYLLDAVLDQSDFPNTVCITAPSGYGKTTLANQLTDWFDGNHRYHQIRPSNVLHTLESTYLEEVNVPTLIVLDDVQHIRGQYAATQQLNHMINNPQINTYLVLVGRNMPDLQWARLMSEGRMALFNQRQLRVRSHELQGAEDVIKRMDGWMMGIQTALRTGDHSLRLQSPSATFAKLIWEPYRKLAFDLQQFLLQIALPHRFDVELCDAIFGGNSYGYIEELLRRDFYVRPDGNGWRLHDLLRDFLLAHGEATQPDDVYWWRVKLARYFEQQNDMGGSANHFIKAGRIDDARRIGELVAKEWYQTGKSDDLLSLHTSLRHAAGATLKLFAGITLTNMNRVDESNAILQDACAEFTIKDDDDNIARVNLQLARNSLVSGHYEQAIALAQSAQQSASSLIIQNAERTIAITLTQQGRYEQAIQRLEAIVASFGEQHGDHWVVVVSQDLSNAYIRLGNLDKAVETLLKCVEKARRVGKPHLIANSLNNLSYAYYLHGQYGEAQDALNDAFELLDNQSSAVFEYLQSTQAALFRDTGKFEMAQEIYKKSLIRVPTDGNLHISLVIAQIRMKIWRGAALDAAQLLSELNYTTEQDSAVKQLLALIELLLLRGNSDEMQLQLDHLRDCSSWVELARGLGLYLAYGIEADNCDLIEDAWQRIRQVPSDLLVFIAADMIHHPKLTHVSIPSDLGHLYNTREGLQNFITLSIPRPYIKLTTLGADKVIVGEKVVKVNKEGSLVFYLLLFNGSMTKEQIGLELWPERDRSKVKIALQTALQRIRKTIPNIIQYVDNLYQVNPDFDISSDYHQFIEYVQKAEALPIRDARTLDLYSRALDLYGGLFLPTWDHHWIAQVRRDTEIQYLQALHGIAKCHIAAQNHDIALRYLQKALLGDPYNEFVFCDILKCYVELGQIAKAQLTYEQFADRVADELNRTLHDSTWELINTIL